MPRLRPRAVLSASDLPVARALVPVGDGAEVVPQADTGGGGGPGGNDPGSGNFIGRLATYIPAEIIAAYQTILGFVVGTGDSAGEGNTTAADAASISAPPHNGALVLVGILLLVLTPVWIYFSTKNSGERPAWHQIINATIAFAVWLLVTGNPIVREIPDWQPLYGSIAMVLMVIIIFPLVELITKPKA
jgi:hypothetical protein